MQEQIHDYQSVNMFGQISHQALLLLDANGFIRFGTQGAWQLLNMAESDAIGVPFHHVLPERLDSSEEGDDALLTQARLLGAGNTAKECSLRKSAGHHQGRWWNVQIEYLSANEYSSEGFAVALSDVTDAYQADEQLRESLRMLNEAEARAGLGHWRLMLNSQTIIWSRGVYRIHGFEEGSHISLDEALNAYLPDDRQRVSQLLEDSIARKEGLSFKASILRPDGVLKAVDVQWDIELDDDEQPVSVFGVIHDCTAENRVTRQIIAARDEALAEAQANRMLLATMSHEIRTPLAGVIGMLDALLAEDAWLNAEFNLKENFKRLRTISTASKALMATLDDVLDHTKIESGNFKLDSFEFDLADIINGTADLFQASALDKKLRLERSVIGPVSVVGDPKRIQQIIANFLSNAIKFTLRGFVKVSLKETSAGQVLIEVADSGVGIAEKEQKKLFTPFQQADDSIYSRFGGTGLGLSICRSLVEIMEGDIGVDSTPGVGSCFWVRLPLRRGAPDNALRERSTDKLTLSQVGHRAPHLLIVDDNKTNALIAEGVLHDIGGTCEEAENGLDALETLLSSSFDAVLLDSSMPVMDGMRCIELIRQLPKPLCQLPVIAYTAHRKADISDDYLAAGFDAVLEKPLRQDQLYNTLSQLFSQQAPGSVAVHSPFTTEALAELTEMADILEAGDQEAVRQRLKHLSKMACKSGDGQTQALFSFVSECVATLKLPQVVRLLHAINHHQTSGGLYTLGRGSHD